MKTRLSPIVVTLLVAVLLCGAVPGQCSIIHVKPNGVDLNDGSTWTLAKRTLRTALTTAVAGDEIWVAAGTYAENVTLKNGVGLYAGFGATESDRSQRDWRSNVTILDAANSGSVVTSPVSVTASAIIDGFTIRNGRGTARVVSGDTHFLGGGIFCTGSSPTITNNTITANVVSHIGGAIYLENSSPVISNNVITRNQAGWNSAGIHCENSSPTIANNFITENTITGVSFPGSQGGGIFCGASSSPAITNNTIAFNTTAPTGIINGGGICCATASSPAISNNIIDSNSSGIFSAGTPSLSHNCVHGNNQHDYVGLLAGDGDIFFDPAFVGPQSANYHIQSGSRCIDAGDDKATQAAWLDVDGQGRKFGLHVDIGADEFWPPPTVTITNPTTESTYPADSATFSLSGTASDGVSAVTWSNDRGGSGKCVGTTEWTASNIALQPGINVIIVTARDAAGFTSVDSLNVSYNTSQAASVYVKPTGNDQNTGESWALAKRTIQAGINAAAPNEEIWVAEGTYSENITLKDGVAVYGGFVGNEGIREQRRFVRNLTIIDGGLLDNAVKALVGTSDATRIDGFTIRRGSSDASGGIFCQNSHATLSNNVIVANFTSQGNGGAVFCSGGSVKIENNLIRANSAGTGNGGAIYCYSCAGATTIVNNTIVENSAATGGGVYVYNCASSMQVVNNIIAFNSSGISGFGISIHLGSNDVFGNTGGDYSGSTLAGKGDISLDPLFVDRAGSDYHLSVGPVQSPCNDAGSSVARDLPVLDIDGQGRINAVVDIGADEVWPGAMVAITSPTSDPAYLSNVATIDIGGTASDGVQAVLWSNDRGGSGLCSGTTTWSAAGIVLAAGQNVITVTADAGSSTAEATLTVFYDAAPPTINITSPTANPTYATGVALLALSGTSSDDTGVTSVAWSNHRGGAGTCTGTTTWSVSGVALQPGVNAISVTAYDAAGKTATARLTVTFADVTPPTLAITTPTSTPTYSTSQPKITLGGTVLDDVGVAGVTWSNDRGGNGTCSNGATWTTGDIPLLAGANVITVTATDTSGNVTTDIITVSYDGTPPTVAITSPTSNATHSTTSSRIDLAGTASDNVAVTRVTWSNSRGGSGICIGTTSWSVAGVLLRPGANVITITASDAAANTAQAILTVTFTDVTAPVCTITGPTPDPTHATNIVKLAISGTASDDAGLASVAWSNSSGGSGTCTGTTSWNASGIALLPGLNTIVVTATDTSGNTGFDMLTVTFTDTTPPVVTITGPARSASVVRTCSTVTLAGTAIDDVGVASISWSTDQGESGSLAAASPWTTAAIPLQPGANVITVSATDSSNNTGSAVITVTYTSVLPGDAWKGLSLVSLPLMPDIADTKQAVGFRQDFWLIYSPSLGDYVRYPDQLTWFNAPEMTPVHGYWAFFDATPASICGTLPAQDAPVAIHLFVGWNLVGEPFLKPVKWDQDTIQVQQLGSAAVPTKSAPDVVGNYAWGWDNVNGRYYLVADARLAPGAVATLDPWHAYWIKAGKECDLILPPP